MNHIDQTIADFQIRLKRAESEVIRIRKTINDLCEMADKPPIYADEDLEISEAKATTTQFAQDAFYNKPLASCMKQIMEQRRARNNGPVSLDDLYGVLLSGGYNFEGKEENRKAILRTTLRKNIDFHRLPNGLYGLTQWYGRVKKSTGAHHETGGESENEQITDNDDNDVDTIL